MKKLIGSLVLVAFVFVFSAAGFAQSNTTAPQPAPVGKVIAPDKAAPADSTVAADKKAEPVKKATHKAAKKVKKVKKTKKVKKAKKVVKTPPEKVVTPEQDSPK